jgi:hypothetical protein
MNVPELAGVFIDVRASRLAVLPVGFAVVNTGAGGGGVGVVGELLFLHAEAIRPVAAMERIVNASGRTKLPYDEFRM